MGGDRLALRSGYVVDVQDGAGVETLSLQAPDGRLCLTIRLEPEGPVLEVSAAAVSVQAERELRLGCRRFEVEAEDDIVLRAGGAVHTTGFEQKLEATGGDVHIEANDDVRVDGERVRLNSPYAPPADPAMASVLEALQRRGDAGS
jgi:hypothetical protein